MALGLIWRYLDLLLQQGTAGYQLLSVREAHLLSCSLVVAVVRSVIGGSLYIPDEVLLAQVQVTHRGLEA